MSNNTVPTNQLATENIGKLLWKYVDELVGKGLEIHLILELLLFASATFVSMAAPLAVLLSSLMTCPTDSPSFFRFNFHQENSNKTESANVIVVNSFLPIQNRLHY